MKNLLIYNFIVIFTFLSCKKTTVNELEDTSPNIVDVSINTIKIDEKKHASVGQKSSSLQLTKENTLKIPLNNKIYAEAYLENPIHNNSKVASSTNSTTVNFPIGKYYRLHAYRADNGEYVDSKIYKRGETGNSTYSEDNPIKLMSNTEYIFVAFAIYNHSLSLENQPPLTVGDISNTMFNNHIEGISTASNYNNLNLYGLDGGKDFLLWEYRTKITHHTKLNILFEHQTAGIQVIINAPTGYTISATTSQAGETTAGRIFPFINRYDFNVSTKNRVNERFDYGFGQSSNTTDNKARGYWYWGKAVYFPQNSYTKVQSIVSYAQGFNLASKYKVNYAPAKGAANPTTAPLGFFDDSQNSATRYSQNVSNYYYYYLPELKTISSSIPETNTERQNSTTDNNTAYNGMFRLQNVRMYGPDLPSTGEQFNIVIPNLTLTDKRFHKLIINLSPLDLSVEW